MRSHGYMAYGGSLPRGTSVCTNYVVDSTVLYSYASYRKHSYSSARTNRVAWFVSFHASPASYRQEGLEGKKIWKRNAGAYSQKSNALCCHFAIFISCVSEVGYPYY
jgi:hypothetical protein